MSFKDKVDSFLTNVGRKSKEKTKSELRRKLSACEAWKRVSENPDVQDTIIEKIRSLEKQSVEALVSGGNTIEGQERLRGNAQACREILDTMNRAVAESHKLRDALRKLEE